MGVLNTNPMNMQVSVHIRGPLAIKSKGPITVSFGNSLSLFECFKSVLKKNPVVRETWKTPEQIIQECLVMVNDVDVGLTGNLDTRLKDGDVVTILPLIHGG